MSKGKIILVLLFLAGPLISSAQIKSTPQKDTLSKFDRFNKKAEALFKIIPVPIITYSSEAGNTFGLANLIFLILQKVHFKASKFIRGLHIRLLKAGSPYLFNELI